MLNIEFIYIFLKCRFFFRFYSGTRLHSRDRGDCIVWWNTLGIMTVKVLTSGCILNSVFSFRMHAMMIRSRTETETKIAKKNCNKFLQNKNSFELHIVELCWVLRWWWSLFMFLGLNDRWPECNWSHSTFLFSYLAFSFVLGSPYPVTVKTENRHERQRERELEERQGQIKI